MDDQVPVDQVPTRNRAGVSRLGTENCFTLSSLRVKPVLDLYRSFSAMTTPKVEKAQTTHEHGCAHAIQFCFSHFFLSTEHVRRFL